MTDETPETSGAPSYQPNTPAPQAEPMPASPTPGRTAPVDIYAANDAEARRQYDDMQRRLDAMEGNQNQVLSLLGQLNDMITRGAAPGLPGPVLPPERWIAVRHDVASRCDDCGRAKMVWVNGRGETATYCSNNVCSAKGAPEGELDLTSQQEIVTNSPQARNAQLVGRDVS